jgi:serine/tyrosine/threonine adenylyltransferase
VTYTPDPKILALGEGYWDVVAPARFPERILRFRNDRAASEVGLDALSAEEWEKAFARFEPLERNLKEPLALRYHGHQFGTYNPHLGDGRGFLFAQLRDARGRLLDLATKGSGTTPWSRGGDGRLTLKGGVREVLAAELLEALGVPTSRAFSLFETGERLMRGDEPSPTRSSVLVRLGHSHIRFGTFQRLARERDAVRMKRLIDFCIDSYFPDLTSTEGDERVVALLDRVCQASARLCARWMTAGFCHGVLNTDNMTITGESFDYGPWRFVPTFDRDFVAAYFDHSGLYAFGRQPAAVQWNLARLADALRTVAESAPLGSALVAFEPRYEAELATATVRRLGLVSAGADIDAAVTRLAWTFLEKTRIGFERFFFDLFGGTARLSLSLTGSPAKAHYTGPLWEELRAMLDAFEPSAAARNLDREGPSTLLIDEVEAIWSAIDRHDDWTAFETKVADIRDAGASYALIEPGSRTEPGPRT